MASPDNTVRAAPADSTKEAAMKQRIISHMNADHQSSLSNYLQHYNRVPASRACDARLDDITLTHLTISSSAGRHLIPLDPPMKSLMDARERSVAMHHESLAGLGKSDTTVTVCPWPTDFLGWFAPLFSIWAFGFLLSPHRLALGGTFLLNRVINVYWPEWAIQTFHVLRPFILWGILVGVHIVETVQFARSRLRKYNVRPSSRVWWLWIGTVLLSGFPAYTRFDKIVAAIEEDKKGPVGKATH